jgi:hypothetical protein
MCLCFHITVRAVFKRKVELDLAPLTVPLVSALVTFSFTSLLKEGLLLTCFQNRELFINKLLFFFLPIELMYVNLATQDITDLLRDKICLFEELIRVFSVV